MASLRPRNKWRSEKFMMPWTRSRQTLQNHTNHRNPLNQLYYHSPRNIHRPHRPHPPLLVTLLRLPPGKWFPRRRVMYLSSRPRPRRAIGSMPPYRQLNLLSRVNRRHRPLLITRWVGSDRMIVAAQYNRMELTVRYKQVLVCVSRLIPLHLHVTLRNIAWQSCEL